MLHLLQLITTKIKEVHPRVYLEEAPQGAEYPYIVYKLPSSFENEFREDFQLVIDLWDNKPSTVALESLVTSLDNKMNRLKYNDTNIMASMYRTNRLMIPDPDPSIRRRQIRYEVKTYFK